MGSSSPLEEEHFGAEAWAHGGEDALCSGGGAAVLHDFVEDYQDRGRGEVVEPASAEDCRCKDAQDALEVRLIGLHRGDAVDGAREGDG